MVTVGQIATELGFTLDGKIEACFHVVALIVRLSNAGLDTVLYHRPKMTPVTRKVS